MFIVFEGLEGAGKEAIAKWCKRYLKKKGKNVLLLSYPDREGFCSKVIDGILTGKVNASPKSQFLMFLADITKDQEKLEGWIDKGGVVVTDRYFFSTIAYQQMQLEEAEKILNGLKLIKPSVVFYLNITPDVSVERTKNERKHFSKYASNKERLLRAKLKYGIMLENNLISKWIDIDATKSLEETILEVKQHLDKMS
jgi:dTMP kinase